MDFIRQRRIRARWGLVVLFVVFASILGLWRQAHAQEEKKIRSFMRPKLPHAQKILEGITLENYEAIANSAKSLHALSELAEWQVLPSVEYSQYSADFRRVANDMTRHAKAKNLDGVTLAYVQMTLACVNCHRHVRDIRQASAK